ncbi:FGGY-family carbohydrate kinase [Yoonia sediminilitoris]|uniref:FGGY-family pentulose kinase n=1 Tax=Yoonia sediminilitoris TaxID=1286148 RepID=A0A2T6K514_9RHOB|nr:FGGY-family carbohydrate kinase [Yoonia sediminilitoris]PUB09716.1 FGGY-family pentulose kinase [Yoonia sediminilitoris]RCW89553.1 FGGY-family pentulose kinase [Yoonia sediminilitoris]
MDNSIAAECYLLGIDVGTGSARAGVFTADGRMVGTDKCPTRIFREGGTIVEQSSADIWQAVVKSVRGAVTASGVRPEQIKGIGFDATCSLVVLGENGAPMPVGEPNHPERNIMVWMDHRALEQAERINATGHRVLDYVGGRISPEMETPKLLWLKENRPEVFAKAWQFMDLTDFLTWCASGDLARSVCTVTCKWTYMAHEGSWDADYFRTAGLEELADEEFKRIGTTIVAAGSTLGTGLTVQAAEEFGLMPGTPVAAGLIDAHAGGIGSVGAKGGGGAEANLAYVFGTSSCTMTTTKDPVFVPGVWGPYYSAMVPGLWLNEGGQSAAGAAIDHLLEFHPHASEAHAEAARDEQSLPAWLAGRVEMRLGDDQDAGILAGNVHVVPEFLGNRAPHADPHTRAVIAGLGMERDLDSLIALYVAGLCGIGYGLRQIVEAQATAGAPVERIVISGGAGRSDMIRQLLADATGVEIAAPSAEEPVLLGSAILGSVAGGIHPNIHRAMEKMSTFAAQYQPQTGEVRLLHDSRFKIFEQLQSVARQAATR